MALGDAAANVPSQVRVVNGAVRGGPLLQNGARSPSTSRHGDDGEVFGCMPSHVHLWRTSSKTESVYIELELLVLVPEITSTQRRAASTYCPPTDRQSGARSPPTLRHKDTTTLGTLSLGVGSTLGTDTTTLSLARSADATVTVPAPAPRAPPLPPSLPPPPPPAVGRLPKRRDISIVFVSAQRTHMWGIKWDNMKRSGLGDKLEP